MKRNDAADYDEKPPAVASFTGDCLSSGEVIIEKAHQGLILQPCL